MSAVFKIHKNLWSLALDVQAASSRIHACMQAWPDVQVTEHILSPSADIWLFSFMSEEFILLNDLHHGLDIRFARRENAALARQFIQQFTARLPSP